jgi:hypothetical protein
VDQEVGSSTLPSCTNSSFQSLSLHNLARRLFARSPRETATYDQQCQPARCGHSDIEIAPELPATTYARSKLYAFRGWRITFDCGCGAGRVQKFLENRTAIERMARTKYLFWARSPAPSSSRRPMSRSCKKNFRRRRRVERPANCLRGRNAIVNFRDHACWRSGLPDGQADDRSPANTGADLSTTRQDAATPDLRGEPAVARIAEGRCQSCRWARSTAMSSAPS